MESYFDDGIGRYHLKTDGERHFAHLLCEMRTDSRRKRFLTVDAKQKSTEQFQFRARSSLQRSTEAAHENEPRPRCA